MPSLEEINSGAGGPNTDPRLRSLAKILRLRETFLVDLLEDPDDWSFVVKAHALLETAVCSLLSQHLRRPELEEVLAEKIEMQARIEMTKALGITASEDRTAMYALGKLRNKLVHSAKDTGFTFADHFKSKDAKKNFADAFGRGLPDPAGTPPVSRADYVQANPKFSVFHAVVRIALYVVTEEQKIQTEMALGRLAAPTSADTALSLPSGDPPGSSS